MGAVIVAPAVPAAAPRLDAGDIPVFGMLASGDTPAFDIGDVPAFDAGDTPAFDIGDTPAFDAGDIPAFDIGDTPAFDAGDTPAFDIGDTPVIGIVVMLGIDDMLGTDDMFGIVREYGITLSPVIFISFIGLVFCEAVFCVRLAGPAVLLYGWLISIWFPPFLWKYYVSAYKAVG